MQLLNKNKWGARSIALQINVSKYEKYYKTLQTGLRSAVYGAARCDSERLVCYSTQVYQDFQQKKSAFQKWSPAFDFDGKTTPGFIFNAHIDILIIMIAEGWFDLVVLRDVLTKKTAVLLDFIQITSPQFKRLLQLFLNAKNVDLSDIQIDSLSKILPY